MPNRGPKIKPNIKALIKLTAREDKRDRRAVAVALQEVIEKLGEAVPGEDTLLRMISEERNRDPYPEDKPWSVATLRDYPIPPQALPVVLKAYKQHTENGGDFTVRQAKWVSRLSATKWAETAVPDQIARLEQLYNVMDHPPDLEVYDKLLAGLEAKANNLMPLYALASLAGILENDPTKRQKKQRKAAK